MTKAFYVVLKDSTIHEVFDDNYAEVSSSTFGEACFDAMMLSDGEPCVLRYVVGGRTLKSWDIAEGENPDFDAPDTEAA